MNIANLLGSKMTFDPAKLLYLDMRMIAAASCCLYGMHTMCIYNALSKLHQVAACTCVCYLDLHPTTLTVHHGRDAFVRLQLKQDLVGL